MIKNNEIEPHTPSSRLGRPAISESLFKNYNLSVKKYKELLKSLISIKSMVEEQIVEIESYLLYLNKL